MAEIQGIKPDFVVPVKLGATSTFPGFIESKRYIDLEALTEEEFLKPGLHGPAFRRRVLLFDHHLA